MKIEESHFEDFGSRAQLAEKEDEIEEKKVVETELKNQLASVKLNLEKGTTFFALFCVFLFVLFLSQASVFTAWCAFSSRKTEAHPIVSWFI